MRTSDPPDLSDLTAEAPPGVRALGPGDVVGGRYRIASLLGAGGFGHVWRAADLLGGEDVALKTLHEFGGQRVERARREVAALRLLRIPGVARLLDDGLDGRLWYLAMELVPGRPFPGPLPCPAPWSDVSDMAVALLETLGRVHAAGIVHRDLKPGNVLVTDDLRPVVLDFGLARGMAVGETITQTGAVLGTPLWLPPEQILGRPAGPAADLYAIGLMLYHALSGRLPHEGDDIQELWAARLAMDPAPLAQLADVPAHVSDLVDSLLARDPADRPATAHDALDALTRRGVRRRHDLPWLGPLTAVDPLLAAALEGRSARLVGLDGSGRTRTLLRVAELLSARGTAIAWPVPAQRPFASVEALIEHPPDLPLEAMSTWVIDALRARLRAGTVILVDSPASLDPWSRRALVEAGAHGPVLSCDPYAPGEAILMPTLGEADLRPLFRGPDRLLHLREDAARSLLERTDGLAARVREEVAAWVRAGLCRWEDGALVVARPALETLATGAPVAPMWVARTAAHTLSRASSVGARVRSSHRELLAWVAIAWPHGTSERIAAASGEPLWRVQAELMELDEQGLIAMTARGPCQTAGSLHAASAWTDEQRRTAHSRLAALLPPGTDERLRHLVAAGSDSIVEEALAIADARRRQGSLGQAARAASEGLAAARALGDLDGEARLLDTLARISLAAGAPEDLNQALYELGRGSSSPALVRFADLLRAGVTVSRQVGAASLAHVEALPHFEDDELEGARQELRVRAARGIGGEVEARTVVEAATWARRRATPWTLVLACGWEGLHLYREGRYDEAADRQMAAAETDDPVLRLAATVGVAASLVETGRLAEAESWAERACEQAAALRLPLSEGQAEWLKRTAAYRRAAELLPDEELVAAAQAVGAPHLQALVGLTEAAVALRAGLPERAAALAGDAARVWRASGRRWEPLLPEALVIACAGGDPEPLVSEAVGCPIPGFGVQILGLLARAAPDTSWLATAETLATEVPRERWSCRLDVLSVEESLAALRA